MMGMKTGVWDFPLLIRIVYIYSTHHKKRETTADRRFGHFECHRSMERDDGLGRDGIDSLIELSNTEPNK